MPKKLRTGLVTGVAMMNTVKVEVSRMKKHRLYPKSFRVTKQYHADTNGLTLELGDTVTIEETLPLSKTKSWKVITKVETGTL